MNKRVCKIDLSQVWSHTNEPKAKVSIIGEDADGDSVRLEFDGHDAAEFVRLAQALAGSEQRTTDQLIAALDERRTLESA